VGDVVNLNAEVWETVFNECGVTVTVSSCGRTIFAVRDERHDFFAPHAAGQTRVRLHRSEVLSPEAMIRMAKAIAESHGGLGDDDGKTDPAC